MTSKKLTIAEAAEQVGVNPRTVQRWINDYGLKAELGDDRKKRVTLDNLQRFVRDFPGIVRMRRQKKRHAEDG